MLKTICLKNYTPQKQHTSKTTHLRGAFNKMYMRTSNFNFQCTHNIHFTVQALATPTSKIHKLITVNPIFYILCTSSRIDSLGHSPILNSCDKFLSIKPYEFITNFKYKTKTMDMDQSEASKTFKAMSHLTSCTISSGAQLTIKAYGRQNCSKTSVLKICN